ncbi:MAG: hypothetical protein AB7F89_18460, partial [Pirellulaceae bacterium]
MTNEAKGSVFEDVFKNIRTAAESQMKMHQDVLRTWATLWPALPNWTGLQTPQAMWLDKIQDFQSQWSRTVSDLARKHREVIDRQYQAALESLEEALRVTESKNPEE